MPGRARPTPARGGLPPNPSYSTAGIEPEIGTTLRLSRSAIVLAKYAVEIADDRFQGYYSFVEHKPTVGGRWRFGRRIKVETAIGTRWRRYGSDSYAQGAGHPNLAYGDRRTDRHAVASLRIDVAMDRHWSALFDAEGEARRSNFPDYEPGVFPSSAQYDIVWSYDNYHLLLGVRVQ